MVDRKKCFYSSFLSSLLPWWFAPDQFNKSFPVEDSDLLFLAISSSKNLEFSFTKILSVLLFIVVQPFEWPGPSLIFCSCFPQSSCHGWGTRSITRGLSLKDGQEQHAQCRALKCWVCIALPGRSAIHLWEQGTSPQKHMLHWNLEPQGLVSPRWKFC